MISGNLEHTKALVYSSWSDSLDFKALLISLIDSAILCTFSESLLVILLIAFTTSIQMLSSLMVSSLFIFKKFYRSRPYRISCHIIVRAGVNGNQKCSDFGNSECSILGIKGESHTGKPARL